MSANVSMRPIKCATVWLSQSTGNYHWSIVDHGDVIAFGECAYELIADQVCAQLVACCTGNELIEFNAPLDVHLAVAQHIVRGGFRDAHLDG